MARIILDTEFIIFILPNVLIIKWGAMSELSVMVRDMSNSELQYVKDQCISESDPTNLKVVLDEMARRRLATRFDDSYKIYKRLLRKAKQ